MRGFSTEQETYPNVAQGTYGGYVTTIRARIVPYIGGIILIEPGATPIDVAARLGHADVSITQNLYAHDTEEMQRATAALFAQIVDK